MVLSLPALAAGWGIDDYVHRLLLLDVPGWGAHEHVTLELFSFMRPGPVNDRLIERGILPWFAHPEVRADLLRPVSALTHMLDAALIPESPALQHAHSLAWFGLGAVLVGLGYRQVLGPGLAAGLAALLFAVDDAHAMPISWIANRNALVALSLGAAGLLLHLKGRRGWALLPLGLGLLAGEAALGALAYVAAWELCAEGGWRARALRLVPATGLVLAWRGLYQWLGYGAFGGGLYVDPGRSPLQFLVALVERGPVLMLAQWLGLPVDLWLLVPRGAQLGLSAAGVLLSIALLAWAWPVLKADRPARFLALGMVLATVPLCAAFPMDRLLLFPSLGAAGLLARVVALEGGRASRALLALTLMGGLLLPLRAGTAVPSLQAIISAPLDHADPGPEALDQTWVVVNGEAFSTFYMAVLPPATGRNGPARTGILAPIVRRVEVTRTGERALEVRVDQGWLASTSERIVRDDTPFVVGQSIRRPGFTAEVLELTADGRPLRMRFTLESDPDLRLWCWEDGRFQPFELPALGETRALEPSLPDIRLFSD